MQQAGDVENFFIKLLTGGPPNQRSKKESPESMIEKIGRVRTPPQLCCPTRNLGIDDANSRHSRRQGRRFTSRLSRRRGRLLKQRFQYRFANYMRCGYKACGGA